MRASAWSVSSNADLVSPAACAAAFSAAAWKAYREAYYRADAANEMGLPAPDRYAATADARSAWLVYREALARTRAATAAADIARAKAAWRER